MISADPARPVARGRERKEPPVITKTTRAAHPHVRVTFSLPTSHPGEGVCVVGDFNGWAPGSHPLRRRSNGRRSVVVELPTGTRARFRYLTERGEWFDDDDADAFEANPHGGHDGVVHT